MTRSRDYNKYYHKQTYRNRRRVHLIENPLCVRCQEQGRIILATIADHVIPHHGNINALLMGELQSLCANCHESSKKFEEKRGYRPDVGEDGWPIDPRHPANRQRRPKSK